MSSSPLPRTPDGDSDSAPYCRVCGGAGNFYQDGRCVPCHVCAGKGRAPLARQHQFDAWGEPVTQGAAEHGR